MSLRNIIGSDNLLENKSLNIVCNTIKANNLPSFPQSTGVPFSYLCDIAGDGDLTFVDVSNVGRIFNGVHNSFIGNATNLVNLNEPSSPIYTRVGDTITISGSFRADVTFKSCSIELNLLNGTLNNNTQISVTGQANKAIAGSQTLVPFDISVSGGDRATIYWYTVNDTPIDFLKMDNTVFFYTITYRNNV